MKFFITAILAPLTLVGCSHEVTVADLESFEITVSTQDDVLRKVGQPNKKLDAGDLIVYAYKIDGEEYVLNFVNTPDGYRFLKTSKLNDEFRNYCSHYFSLIHVCNQTKTRSGCCHVLLALILEYNFH